MLHLYRGERKCFQDVVLSPRELVVSLLVSSEISSFYPDVIHSAGFDLSSISS